MPNKFRLQSDEEKNYYLRQLYGGDPPSMDYYRQLGEQKRIRLESERQAREQQKEREREQKKKEKEKEKEEENRLLQELIQSARQTPSVPELPTAQPTSGPSRNTRTRLGTGGRSSNNQGFFGNIAGLGKDVGSNLLHIGKTAAKGVGELGKVAFTDYTFEDMRKAAKEQEKTNKKEFTPYSGKHSSNLSREIDRGVKRASNTATFGMMEDSIREQGFDDSAFDQRKGVGAAGDVLYDILGALGPGGAIASGVRGTRAGAQILPQMNRLQRTGQYAKEGAVAGGMYGALDAHATELRDPDERTLGRHIGNIGLEAGLGAVIDPAIMGLTNAVGRGISNFRNRGMGTPSTPTSTGPDFSNYDPTRMTSIANDPTQLNPMNSRRNTLDDILNIQNNQSRLRNLDEVLDVRSRNFEADQIATRQTDIQTAQSKQAELRQTLEDLKQKFMADNRGQYKGIANEKEIADGLAEWQTTKEMRDQYKQIRASSENQFYIPDQYREEFGKIVPQSFIRNNSTTDIFKAAEMHGFEGTHEGALEFAHYLRSLQQANTTRMRDLVPEPEGVPVDYLGVDSVSELTFPETPDAQGLQQVIDAYDTQIGNMQSQPLQDFTQTGEYQSAQNIRNLIEQDISGLESSLPRKERSNVLADLGLLEAPTPTPTPQTRQPRTRLPEGSVLERPKDVDGPIAYTETSGIFDKIRNLPQTLRNTSSKLKYELDSKTAYAKEIEQAAIKLDPSNQADLKYLSNGTLDVNDSFYKSLRNTTLAPQKAAQTFNQDYIPIVRDIRKTGVNYEEFNEFVAAKHFDDILRNNADKAARATEIEDILMRDASLSDDAVDKLLKELEGLEDYILPEYATPQWVNERLSKHADNTKLNELQQRFVQEQKKDLKTLYDAGHYTKKQYEELVNSHENYVSMRRDIEGLSDSSTRTAAARTRHVDAIKARKRGSTDQIIAPMESALHNRFRAVKSAEMNKAKSKLANLAKLDKDEVLLRKVKPNEAHLNQKNIVSFKQKGVEQFYEVPPNLHMTLESFGGEHSASLVTDFIQSVGRFSKKGMTHFNPKFHLKASIRDTQNAFLTSRSGANPIDYAAGFMDAFFGPQLSKITGGRFKSYRNVYQEMGGEFANWIKHEPVDIARVLKSMQKGKTGKGDTVLNPLKWVEELGAKTEMGPRLGEFRASARKGNTPESSLFEAIDVIDYQDLGNSIEKLNKYIPYLGPTIRGNLRFMKAMKEKPAATMIKGFSTLGTASAGVYMMRFAETTNDAQRQKLENMPEWQKNLFWAIPNPAEDSDGLIMIPKGFLVGQVFSNPIERALDHMYGPENKDSKQILKETKDDFVQALMPPTAMAGISTIMELVNNQDSFLGMPIVTDEMQDKPKPEQFDEYTSEAAKLLGKWMGLSPAQIDHILKSTTGGVGKDILDLGDNLAASRGMRPAGTRTTEQILNPLDQFQFDDTGSSKFSGELYEANRREADTKSRVRSEYQAETGLRLANDVADPSDVEYYNDLFRDVNQDIKAIRQNTTMSPAQKRDAISELRNEQRAYGSRVAHEGVLENQEQNLGDLENRLRSLGPANVTPTDLKQVLGDQLMQRGVPREDVNQILALDLTTEQLAAAIQDLMGDY